VIGDKSGGLRVLVSYSAGLKTSRDAWCYKFPSQQVENNIRASIDYYNGEVDRINALTRAAGPPLLADDVLTPDSTRFSWDRINKRQVTRGVHLSFDHSGHRAGAYRPFTKQHVYFDVKQQLNNCTYQLPSIPHAASHESRDSRHSSWR
jgi:predicted helicase